MKVIALVLACTVLASGPTLACRGAVEYPVARAQLAKANLDPAEREALSKELEKGWALHQRGHQEIDPTLMRESVEILDAIKVKIGI